MKTVHFINLTNGIQAIKDFDLKDYRFIRLQSTACEQKRWENIILSISDEFLLSASLGSECIVYDYGANKEKPRAIWQGLEWIKFCLYKRWFNIDYNPVGRCSSSKRYFEEQYFNLSNRVKSRLDYFKSFIEDQLSISSVTGATKNDGNKEFYSNILKKGA